MILKTKEYALGMLNRGIFVYIFIKIVIVLFGRKIEKTLLLNGVNEIDKNFKYVKNKINENNLKQSFRYRSPKHETIDQLENVLVFDLETYNDQEFAEAYATGLYDVNCLKDNWNGDLTSDESVIEREIVTVFDGSNENPVMNVLNSISENYEGDERIYIDKDGDEIVSSYRLLLVARNSAGLDSWAVLNSLVKKITDIRIIKIAKGLISLSFRCGVKIVNTVKVPQNVKFTCSKSHIEGSLEKIDENTVYNPNFSKEK